MEFPRAFSFYTLSMLAESELLLVDKLIAYLFLPAFFTAFFAGATFFTTFLAFLATVFLATATFLAAGFTACL